MMTVNGHGPLAAQRSAPSATSDGPRELDVDALDLRVSRGAVPAGRQLADRLRQHILEQQLPPGGRLPTEKVLMNLSGLSRVTVRAAVGILETEGLLVRRQGLGTFVAEPVDHQFNPGVRTITEVLVDSGLTPRVEVLSHGVVAPPQRVMQALGPSEVLRIRRRYSDAAQPLALVTIYLPTDLGEVVNSLLSAESPAETTYTMWEKRLGVRIGHATHDIHAAAASAEVAEALDVAEGTPVLVLDRTSYATDGRPLEVVTFHHRADRYSFSLTLPREVPGPNAGVAER